MSSSNIDTPSLHPIASSRDGRSSLVTGTTTQNAQEPIRRGAGHQERAATLKRRLREAGLPVLASPSHIVPVPVGDPVRCKAASDLLLERHRVYVQPINYPTVPKGTERLRLTPSPLHDDPLMDRLVEALRDVWGEVRLGHAA